MLKFFSYTIITFILFIYPSIAQEINSPESICYDKKRNYYYVSNVGTQGLSDGTIMIYNKDGSFSKLLDLTLTDPKGLTLIGDTLIVTDINRVLFIDVNKKTLKGQTNIADAFIFLNDVVADGKGYCYVSDMQGNRIFKINISKPNTYESLVFSGTLKTPNGLWYDDKSNSLIIVSYTENATIKALDLTHLSISTLSTTQYHYFDGITSDGKGTYYISAWQDVNGKPKAGKIFKYTDLTKPDGQLFAADFDGPADIFYDTTNGLVCVPVMANHTIEFISLIEKLPAPKLIFPMNNAVDMGTIITFNWSKVEDALNYTFQISKSSDFKELFYTKDLNENSLEIKNLEKSTTYYWRVKANALDKQGEWSTVNKFTCSALSYSPPTLVSPANNAEFIKTNPTFMWNASKTSLYKLQVSAKEDFSTLAISVSNITDTSYVYQSYLQKNTQYYWRVKTYSGYVESDWSNSWTFKTNEYEIPQPQLITPTNQSSNVSLTPTFVWKKTDAESYKLQVSKKVDYTSDIILDISNLTDTSYVPGEPLQLNTTYYWRILATKNGKTAWSTSNTFKTTNDTYIDEKTSKLIKIYPLPVNNEMRINIDNQLLNLNYSIYSSDSKLLLSGTFTDGQTIVDTKLLSSGTYYLIIDNISEKLSYPFIIVR